MPGVGGRDHETHISDEVQIVPVLDADQIQQARALFEEYQRHIAVDLCFQGFADELATLPGAYAPPSGQLLLAMDGVRVAGCVALRELSGTACEMKRLFVRPAFQGRGLGRLLVRAILEESRRIGYAVMRLDTLPSMREATRLYASLGFEVIPAYYASPLEGTLFFERRVEGGTS